MLSGGFTHAAVRGLALVSAVIVGVLGFEAVAGSGSPTRAVPPPTGERLASHPPGGQDAAHHSRPSEGDGVVPDDTTVFDSGTAGVAKLDPALLGVLRRAATDAARVGVTFYVDSGWRSRNYQEQLFRDAVARYGSPAAAARWVAPPGTSAHESGDAVDLGHAAALAWLSAHGARYGLCQIYGNEPWHYELRPAAVDRGCPPMYADPTHDPRLAPRA